MAAPKFTLTYFDSPGRAEVTRLAFAAKGVEFKDVRLTNDEWQKLKPSTPQGQLPIMEIEAGGQKTVLCQSNAISRYVAREYGLYGKTSIDEALVNVTLDTIDDMFKELIKVFSEKDETEKAKLKADLGKTVSPKFIKLFEDMKGDKDWIVGSEMTVADLAVFNIFTNIMSMFGEDAAKCYRDNKSLQAHAKRVSEYKGIKEWLAKQSVKK